MLSSIILLFTCLAAFAVTLPTSSDASVVPGKYIVEFEGFQGSVAASDFYKNLTESGLDASHHVELSHALLSGVSFALHDHEDLDASVDKIASMRIVKNIWPVRVYSWPVMNSSTMLNLDAAVQRTIQGRQEQKFDTYATHVMGGVNKLHAEGFTGKGLFVAIVDYGVDYNHPALGGGFGPGFKIAHGYDFVGDAYTGFNAPVPDSDPFSSCQPHGTHVSGIVGANKNPWNFTGVVPDATLGMYRVGGCWGGSGSDVVIAAFLKAQEDGADVITASIGAPAGWTEVIDFVYTLTPTRANGWEGSAKLLDSITAAQPGLESKSNGGCGFTNNLLDALAVAVSRIIANGTPCSVAAGNDGYEGPFYASEPGLGVDVLSVGSIDSITSPGWNQCLGTFTVTGNANSTTTPEEFFYVPSYSSDFIIGTLPLWTLLVNDSTSNDPCSPFSEGTPDLSDKLVLMEGTPACSFDVLASQAADFGAKYVFFYHEIEGAHIQYDGNASIDAVAGVSYEQATSWVKLLEAGYSVEVNITGAIGFFTFDNELTGGYMSTYSDWSPTFDMYMKPQVSAPGRNILSTYPLVDGGYAVNSGTSMAAPYIGGVIALIKQIRGKLIHPKTITSIIGNTAKPRYFNDGSGRQYPFLAPAFQQGGGLVDAYAAAHISTFLSKSSILLNDTAHFNDRSRFSIQNTGNQPVKYAIAHQPAGTAYTLPGGTIKPSIFPPEFASTSATLEITPQSIIIPAGASADIAVKFVLPLGVDKARLPLYSGYIAINGTNGDVLTLPYGGVAADLESAGIIDTQEGYPYLLSSADDSLTPLPGSITYTLPKFNNSIPANETSHPKMALTLAMGSAYAIADLVPISKNFTCTIETGRTALAVLEGFPQTYIPRNKFLTGQYSGNGTEADSVPAGNYTILVRALRIFGNRSLEKDYDVACTNHFVIQYA